MADRSQGVQPIDVESEAGERRGSVRHGLRLEADVTLPGDLTIVGHTMDLSSGGVSIEVPYMLEFGQQCLIELDLSSLGGPSWLQLTAEVRHCRQLAGDQYLAGLQFVEPDPAFTDLMGDVL